MFLQHTEHHSDRRMHLSPCTNITATTSNTNNYVSAFGQFGPDANDSRVGNIRGCINIFFNHPCFSILAVLFAFAVAVTVAKRNRRTPVDMEPLIEDGLNDNNDDDDNQNR